MTPTKMKLGPDILVEECRCLDCGVALDGAKHVVGEDGQEHVPHDGAITICYKCGHIMAFNDKVQLRELTSEEAYAVAGDPTVLTIIDAIAKVRTS